MNSRRLLPISLGWAGFAIHCLAATHFVDGNSANPLAPYGSWNTAATNIQDAVNASTNGDLILVTNGLYSGGVLATNPITIQSVNGASVTTINGNHSAGCVNLADGSSLSGLTLTNGYGFTGGGVYCESTNVFISNCIIISNTAWGNYSGGVYSGTLTNCALINNASRDGAGASFSTLINCTLSGNNSSDSGGGAFLCTLNNCFLYGNLSVWGGGAISSTLNNCVVTNNSASILPTSVGASEALGGGIWGSVANNCIISGNHVLNPYGDTRISEGGGAYAGTLNNCVLFKNTANQYFGGGGAAYNATLNSCTVVGNSTYATAGGTYNCTVNNSIVRFNGSDYSGGTFNHCCVLPLPPGAGNFTNDPVFIDKLGGNLRLLASSPCINSGINSFATNSTDLDGNPRIMAGTVDVGAYEYQTPTSILSYIWAQQFNLPTDGSADNADPDSDGLSNWQEWIAGTNPTNATSVLQMMPLAATNSAGITVTWSSVTNRTYYVQRASDFTTGSAFTSLQSNIVGQAVTTSFVDNSATNAGPYYYRVGVQ